MKLLDFLYLIRGRILKYFQWARLLHNYLCLRVNIKVFAYIFFFNWDIVDFQCCVNSGVQKNESGLHLHNTLQYSGLGNPMGRGTW